MQILYDRIRKDGIVRAGNVLKVDRFLNHQMDIHLFQEIGKEFKRRFEGEEINKILTIEASGIGIACIVAEYFDVPVVFAKKTKTKNIAGEVYTTKVESFTHKIRSAANILTDRCRNRIILGSQIHKVRLVRFFIENNDSNLYFCAIFLCLRLQLLKHL